MDMADDEEEGKEGAMPEEEGKERARSGSLGGESEGDAQLHGVEQGEEELGQGNEEKQQQQARAAPGFSMQEVEQLVGRVGKQVAEGLETFRNTLPPHLRDAYLLSSLMPPNIDQCPPGEVCENTHRQNTNTGAELLLVRS